MSWLLRHGAKEAGFELQPGLFYSVFLGIPKLTSQLTNVHPSLSLYILHPDAIYKSKMEFMN